MRQPCFLRKPPADPIELALTQGTDQVAANCDLVTIPAGEALLCQSVDPGIECGADLGTEAGAREIGSLTSNQPPVEPGCPVRGHLLFEIEIRAHGKRDPLPASRVLETTELHNAADRTITGRIDVREF